MKGGTFFYTKMLSSCGGGVLLFLLLVTLFLRVSGLNAEFLHNAAAASSPRWAVLLSTSRYWHNYRHASNTLSFNYLLHTAGGIPDDNILLFLADCPACNPRNYLPGTIYNNQNRQVNLYGGSPIDFTGYDVTIRQFLPTLRGEYDAEVTPLSRRLVSDDRSNLIVYLTGHGGEGFLKFQDSDYLYTEDLLAAVRIMKQRKLFGRLLVIVETCHAESLCIGLDDVEGVACVASSAVDKESFSHHSDAEIGVDVIDFFSYTVLEELRSYDVCLHRQRESREFSERDAKPTTITSPSPTLHRFFSRIPFAVVVDKQRLLHTWRVDDFFCE